MRQAFSTVSNATNPGLPTTPQHVLREAQQQRIARPGPSQPYANVPQDENFLISPQGTPHSQRFDAACFDASHGALQQHQQHHQQQQDCLSASYDAYSGPLNVVVKKNQAGFASSNNNGMAGTQDYGLFGPDSALSTPTYVTFQDSPAGAQGWISEEETSSTRRTSRRISNGIMDRVAKFEGMGGPEGGQRPVTPPNQNEQSMMRYAPALSHLGNSQDELTTISTGYFPPTPKETPHDRMAAAHQPRLGRFADDYDESMEETIKPSRSNRSNRSSAIFQEMRQQAEGLMSLPPRANTMPMAVTTGDFMSMNNVNTEFLKIEHGYDGLPVVTDIHMGQPMPSHHHGMAADPAALAVNTGAFDNKPDLRPPPEFDSQATVSPFGQFMTSPTESRSASRRASPHRRTESLASIASAASIASINIDETRTETGVSVDDIAAFIEGPDPADGKWLCLYDDCGKRFGRKENIKSHVQTHLNDRQYQCPSCHKCFVRQHDLKRHAKIHTGIKPYPCECGNTFARHDALTRHRQRGMCIGAFDGIVRKVVKRGRPRKNRPDMESRLDKSARTRHKNRSAGGGGSSPSATSQSGYSDSSAPNSPGNDDFDHMLDSDMLDVGMVDGSETTSSVSAATATTMDPSALAVLSTAPMPTLSLAPDASGDDVLAVVSPEHVSSSSPSAMSHYSQMSRLSLADDDHQHHQSGLDGLDGLPVIHPGSPAKSIASHYSHHHPGTPPELSASSSPPPSSARFFDLDPNSSCTEESIGLGAPLTSAGTMPTSAIEDDLLKAFTTEDVLVQLDSSGLGMLNSRFDEEYGMFTNSDDFFG